MKEEEYKREGGKEDRKRNRGKKRRERGGRGVERVVERKMNDEE